MTNAVTWLSNGKTPVVAARDKDPVSFSILIFKQIFFSFSKIK
jgi:hypothetical protein